MLRYTDNSDNEVAATVFELSSDELAKGVLSLEQLFAGTSQLVVYHLMYGPPLISAR